MGRSEGDNFQDQFFASCKSLGVFCERVKDQYIPHNVRLLLTKHKIHLPTTKNKYDFYLYSKPNLYTLEFKSINAKSISVTDPKIIKPHQIEALDGADKSDGVIPGFIFNFRGTEENETYFVHIKDFLEYKNIAVNGISNHTYKSKVNKSSIPVGICAEIGIRINNFKKRTKYHYHVKEFIKEAEKRYE